jgi:hypothetical protein
MLLVVLICFDDHGGSVLGDAAHLPQSSMLRASPDATGLCCWVRVCDVSPGRLPWSSMLPVDQLPTRHNFLPKSYVESQLLFYVME